MRHATRVPRGTPPSLIAKSYRKVVGSRGFALFKSSIPWILAWFVVFSFLYGVLSAATG